MIEARGKWWNFLLQQIVNVFVGTSTRQKRDKQRVEVIEVFKRYSNCSYVVKTITRKTFELV